MSYDRAHFFCCIFARHYYDNVKMNHRKGISFAIVTALLWGVLAVVIKMVLVEVDAITVVWVRMLTASLGLSLFFAIREPAAFQVFVSPPKLIWLPAVGIALNYIAYAKGIDMAGPASAQVIIQMGPILLCLAGFFIFKETFILRQRVGFVIALLGLLFFYWKQIGAMDTGQEDFFRGVMLTLGGAVAWAVYSISQKALVRSYPVLFVNLFIFTFATLVYTPFVDFSVFRSLSMWVWFGLLFLGINTLVAYGCLGEALKYTDAGMVSVIVLLNPIITFFVLYLLERHGVTWFVFEHVPILAYVGAALMLFGAVLSTFRARAS